MSLKNKLIALIFFMSVIPALIVGVTSLQYSSHALDTLALKQATTLQKINANQTTQHFIDIQNNIETLADSLSLLIEKQGLETAIVDVDPYGQSLFSRYIERNNYNDLFLLDLEGYCFYSVTQQAGCQTNLVSGRYKDSGLGEVVQKTIAHSRYHMSDVTSLSASNTAPEAFIAAPVSVQGDVVVILAMQLSAASMGHITSERSGMGNIGKADQLGALATASVLKTTTLTMATIGIVVVALLAFIFADIITKPMHLLASVIGKIERTGDLSIRYPDFTRDEAGQTGHALNSLLESQQKAIEQIHLLMGAIAVGDFTARIKTASQGDLGHLEQTINQSVSTLELAVQEVTRMAWVMSEGDLTQVTRNDLEGEFDNIALALKCVSISVEGIVDDVRAIAEDMKQRGEAVGISTKHAIELNNLMKFFSTNAQDPSSVKAKQMLQSEEIKRLVSDLNG
tara:strand:+ start:448 stop:1809 length:1362 start_codon:yes stop_codon:yes gene_type:complete